MLYKWQEENLRKYRPQLVEYMDMSGLLTLMQSKGIITKRQVASIEVPLNDPYRKVEMVLDHLYRRPPQDYDKFINCLKEIGQHHIAQNYLVPNAKGDVSEQEQAKDPEDEYIEPKQNVSGEAEDFNLPPKACSEESGQEEYQPEDQYLHTNVEGLACQVQRMSLSQENIYEDIDYEACNKGCVQEEGGASQDPLQLELERAVSDGIKVPIRVMPTVPGKYRELSKSSDIYPMVGRNKGKCCIVSVECINGFDKRSGTDQDKHSLEMLFTSIGYSVKTYTDKDDLSAKGIIAKVEKFSADLCIDDPSAVLCILTHGEKGVLYGTDGSCVSIKTILSKLDNINCKNMHNKPKLFFTQACRGAEIDYGAVMSDSKPSRLSEYDGEKLPRLPVISDFLIGYATQEDHRAWRRVGGSFYIRALVIVFMKYAHELSIQDMLVKVNDIVSKVKIKPKEDLEVCQMPTFESQLRKRLYFFPGIDQ